jgi:uncharacterized membrane protein SpoIIM required for sporulation
MARGIFRGINAKWVTIEELLLLLLLLLLPFRLTLPFRLIFRGAMVGATHTHTRFSNKLLLEFYCWDSDWIVAFYN